MTVWKFPLKVTGSQIILIPKINYPLTVQIQGSEPCLWAVVDPDSPRIHVIVRTFGTGQTDITHEMDYIGTYQLADGGLVFHIFVEKRSEAKQ